MKKGTCLFLVSFTTLFVFSCSPGSESKNESPIKEDFETTASIDTTEYSAKAIQEEALKILSKLDNVTEEQHQKIQKILDDAGVFTLKNRKEFNKYRRLLKKRIRKEVLTKEQIQQYLKITEG